MLTGMRYRVVSMAGVAALTVAAVLIASHPPIQELLGAVPPAGGLQPVPLMPGERTFAAVVAAVGMTVAFVGLSHRRPWRAEALVSRSSKTCSACGTEDGSQRVERGLYVCESCGRVANADINGAENIRGKVLPSLTPDGGDRDIGWMAQPAVRLFDRSEGRFAPREQVVDCKP